MRSNRLNQNGLVENLRFIMKIDVNLFGLCDYLWNSGYLETLFLELFRLHEYQITKVCEVYRQKYVQIYSETKYMVLFEIIFNGEFDVEKYQYWRDVRNRLIFGAISLKNQEYENGCMFLCDIIKAVEEWKDINIV